MKSKTELIKKYADMTGLNQKDAEKAFNAFVNLIKNEVKEEGMCSIHALGKFEVKERTERSGVNPQTKKEIVIPATRTVKFKAAKDFKEIVK